MRCLLCTLALVLFAGCRSQTTALSNPFLAPDRVPPPSTRTLLPGTAQPYYPGDPVPNTSAVGVPPAGFAPGIPPQPATPTYAPQPAGTVPPGGWNTTPQPYPNGSSSRNVLPNNVQPASANIPVESQPPIQVQPDQQSLRFGKAARSIQNSVVPAGATLQPDPSILPTPQQAVAPLPSRQSGFQLPVGRPPFIPQASTATEPRAVQIRAISSDNLPPGGSSSAASSRSRDGFRPQGSSRVRKPTMISRLEPRKRSSVSEQSDRFGVGSHYEWLRGQLQYASSSGLWSLRYAPGEGDADPLGGSLTIANPQVLGGLQPGDFVQLRGRVDQAPIGANPTAPVYSVSVVQRQRI